MPNKDSFVIQTAGLTKVFRDFWYRQRVTAVENLDFEVHKDEVFGLLGPNGSGKTTTIKMLLGLLYPTRGRIQVLGRAPTDVAVKSRIGFLPEESYLYRFLNAREILDYYGQLFRIPRQERRRRVEQLLEMTGLVREARRRVGEYSKGMARRIGLAQALINDPDLLILDEPTSGLDPVGTREIKDLISFLNREKRKTILLCSHLLADVEDVCQRVAVMYGGRLQAMGTIHELLSQENLTQITTDKLTPQTVERIRSIVESEQGRHVINVSAPSDRLETFFLRIVRQAQQLRQATSGATGGGRIAEFLAESPSGDKVVESLVAAASKPEQARVAPAPRPVEPATNVLQDLISAPRGTAEPTEPPAVEPPVSAVDQSIIDGLVGGPGHQELKPRLRGLESGDDSDRQPQTPKE
jgi:ABC-2 type transport system ATP-binding protein